MACAREETARMKCKYKRSSIDSYEEKLEFLYLVKKKEPF